jgi:predicted SAM-dependent methyltransferase
MTQGTTSLKLHVGAFDHIIPGWINTDITPHLVVARVPGLAWMLRLAGMMSDQRYAQHCAGVFRQLRHLDVSRRFPWRDAALDAVYSSHLLEHLFPDEARHCLREMRRVLKPGGVCRLAVPDLDALVRAYAPADPEPFLDAIFEGRHKRDKNRHHWHYNEALLRRTLLESGFTEVRRCGYRQGRCPDVERADTRAESLFMESSY